MLPKLPGLNPGTHGSRQSQLGHAEAEPRHSASALLRAAQPPSPSTARVSVGVEGSMASANSVYCQGVAVP
jgi:hypothetical protein